MVTRTPELANRHLIVLPIDVAERLALRARLIAGRARVPTFQREMIGVAALFDACVQTGRRRGCTEVLEDLHWFKRLCEVKVAEGADAFLIGRLVGCQE